MTDSAPPRPMRPVQDAGDDRLLESFRGLQLQHARVLHHESVVRAVNVTDLRFVFFLAASPLGVTPKQAGEYLELSTGAVTSVIDRLQDAGHLERRRNPDDRRSVLLHLTRSGSEIANEIGDVYRAAFRATAGSVAPDVLVTAFEQVSSALARHTDAPPPITAPTGLLVVGPTADGLPADGLPVATAA